MNESQKKILRPVVALLLMIAVLLGAFAIYGSSMAGYIKQTVYVTKNNYLTTSTQTENMISTTTLVNTQSNVNTYVPSLPPFANVNFDVLVTPYIVTVPASGGSVDVNVEIIATNLTVSETLVLETRANIPGYSANFNTTSVTLNPGGSISIGLTVLVPNGVQSGIYPMGVIAQGENTQGGGWLLINVGSSQTVAPP